MATFILVHGGWQGGWSYKALARLLRDEGHAVHVATLTGLGERSHLASLPINLGTHIEDVANIIGCEDLSEVVLVGHSYGGMVITGVADRLPERVAMLVYLDATVPENGDTLIGLRPEFQRYFLDNVTADGRLVSPPPASGFDAAEQHWALIDAKNVAHPLACFTQAIELSGAHAAVTRRLYIYAAGNLFDGDYERFRDVPGSQVHRIAETGHSIMLDQPEALCAILHDAVQTI